MEPPYKCGNFYFVITLFYFPCCLKMIVAALPSGFFLCGDKNISLLVYFSLSYVDWIYRPMFWFLCSSQNHLLPNVYNITKYLVRLELIVYAGESKPFNYCNVWISLMDCFPIWRPSKYISMIFLDWCMKYCFYTLCM